MPLFYYLYRRSVLRSNKQANKKKRRAVLYNPDLHIGLMRTEIPVKIIYLKVFIMKSTKCRMRNGKRYGREDARGKAREKKQSREKKESSISISIILFGNSPSVGVN